MSMGMQNNSSYGVNFASTMDCVSIQVFTGPGPFCSSTFKCTRFEGWNSTFIGLSLHHKNYSPLNISLYMTSMK